MTPRVKLLSTVAGAALLVSVLLIAVTQIRRASAPAAARESRRPAEIPGPTGTGRSRPETKAAPFKLNGFAGRFGFDWPIPARQGRVP